LWSDRFDRELADVFALQDEIAAAVAEALNHTFEPSADVAPIDPVAYELYLRARAPTMAVAVGPAAADWMWPSDAGLLEEALARAPKFAQAWAELALAKAVHAQSQPSVKEFNALSDQAKRAAVMALSLDEQSGGAFAAQSLLLPLCGKFEEREQLLEKGRAATPNDELLLLQSSVFLSRVGRLDEALDLVTQAYELNPLIPNVVYWRAETLFNVGRQAEAFALWDQGRARWPAHPGMHLTAMFYAATVGDWARVDALMPGADELAAIHPREAAGLAAVGYLRDPPADARDVLKEVGRGQIARTGTLEFTFIGFIAFAGFVDSAYDLVDAASFAHLSEPGPAASANGSPHALFDAQNAPLRDDVRFVALCARLGLCDYWVNTDRWPDCADQIPYDFRDEARRLVGGPRG
ncbi:MAG: hypothetical protein ACRDQZ_15500, partial [Mycobacteriales bacterium]